jgi:hypothetical protein
LIRYAAEHGLEAEAIRSGLKHQIANGSELTRGLARTAANRIAATAAASEAAAAEAAGVAEAVSLRAAAAEAARVAGMTTAEVNAAVAAESAAAVEVAAGAEAGVGVWARVAANGPRIVAGGVVLLLLALGVYVLSGQLGRFFADRPSTAPGWRMRLAKKEQADKKKKSPLDVPQSRDGDRADSFLPQARGQKSSGELWRKGWAGAGPRIVSRKPGAIVQLLIIENVDGLSGQVSFLDGRSNERTADVKVADADGDFAVSYESGSGTVAGTLQIDEQTAWLNGTLEMPSKLGGKVKVSLIPQSSQF